MELEQKVRYLIALGLSEKAARYYLRYETDTWAVVPSFRLLKPLSDDLEFYRGRYRELLVQWQGEGVLEKKDPEATRRHSRPMSCSSTSWTTTPGRR